MIDSGVIKFYCQYDDDTTPTLWFEMPYIGHKGKQLLCGLTKKLKRYLTISGVRIVTRTTTTKLNMFINEEDKTPKENKCSAVYVSSLA